MTNTIDDVHKPAKPFIGNFTPCLSLKKDLTQNINLQSINRNIENSGRSRIRHPYQLMQPPSLPTTNDITVPSVKTQKRTESYTNNIDSYLFSDSHKQQIVDMLNNQSGHDYYLKRL